MGCTKLTPELSQEIKAIRAEKGLTLKEIAALFNCNPQTVSKVVGPVEKEHAKVTPKLVEDMQTYRELGLSNIQIAKEMNISRGTVRKYLGNQPAGVRSEYGSIAAHATGDSYVKTLKEKDVQKEPAPIIVPSVLNLSSIVTTFKGNSGIKYKLNGSNQVQIVTETGENMTFETCYFMQFAQEIAELCKFIEVNRPKA